MSKVYKLEKDTDGTFSILDPDGDIIFSYETNDYVESLLHALNYDNHEKYEITYNFDKNNYIVSSQIVKLGVLVFRIVEHSVSKEEDTRGYGILTHLNRNQFSF